MELGSQTVTSNWLLAMKQLRSRSLEFWVYSGAGGLGTNSLPPVKSLFGLDIEKA